MKHLVTGGAGFLGLHLATALAASGDSVDLADDLSRGALDADLEGFLQRPGVRLIRCDLAKPEPWRAWDDAYDGVFHLAGIVGVRNVLAQPDRVLAANARSVLNVVEWFCASGSRKLFFASTSEVYAWTAQFHPIPVPTPEAVPLAVDDVGNERASYALSKTFGEMAVTHACRRAGKAFAIARYHNVYGPRMGMDHVIPELLKRLDSGARPVEVYSPEERRAFCYVSDAVQAMLGLMRDGVKSGTYNIGNDREEIRIEDLARLVFELAGAPDAPMVPVVRPGAGIARRCPDLSRLAAGTGFRPAVPLREGVRRTIDWYRRNPAC